MNWKRIFTHRTASWLLAGSLLIAGALRSEAAVIIFTDTFDGQAVGSFPSTWTNVNSGPNSRIYVTNNIAGTPTAPNAFQFANLNTNETFEAWRQFPQYNLNTSSNLVLNYRLNVSVMPNDFSGGFRIGPANLPTQGEETFAIPRFTRGTMAGTFQILNFNSGLTITNNLPLNTWNDFRFEIDPSETNAANGVVRWYLNNNHYFTQNFNVPSPARTNINTFFVKETFPGFPPYPITTFYIDNVSIFAELPEPSALLLIGATGLAWVLRRRR